MHTVAHVTPVRAAPAEDAEQVTQILPGEPVTVDETEHGWARVRTAYDYPGWIRADTLEAAAASDWLPAPNGLDPVDAAAGYLGAPYEWGGMTTHGIDCSGLVHIAYRSTGRVVPRDADQQEAAGTPVDKDGLRRGDLVCFGEPGRAHHVAFWLGDGRILHSTERQDVNGVVEEPLENVREELVRFVRL